MQKTIYKIKDRIYELPFIFTLMENDAISVGDIFLGSEKWTVSAMPGKWGSLIKATFQ